MSRGVLHSLEGLSGENIAAYLEYIFSQIDYINIIIALLALITTIFGVHYGRKSYLESKVSRKSRDRNKLIAKIPRIEIGIKEIAKLREHGSFNFFFLGRTEYISKAPSRDLSQAGEFYIKIQAASSKVKIDRMAIVVTFSKGGIAPDVHTVVCNISPSAPNLLLEGPSLPLTLGRLEDATWSLPKIIVLPFAARTEIIPSTPNAIAIHPRDAIRLSVVVELAGLEMAFRHSILFGTPSALRRQSSKFADHMYYLSFNELYESDEAPEELKHLLSLWNSNIKVNDRESIFSYTDIKGMEKYMRFEGDVMESFNNFILGKK